MKACQLAIVGFLTLVVFAIGIEIALLLMFLGVVSGLAWTFLASKLTPKLVPRKIRESILFRPPLPSEEISCKDFVYYSFIPGLFVFSIATLISDIINYQIASGEGLIYLAVITMFLLPFVFISAAKMALNTAEIDFIEGHYIRRVELIPYFEEFVGFGALLGFLVYAGELISNTWSQYVEVLGEAGVKVVPEDIVILVSTNIGYILGYLILILYPSTLAMLTYMVLGYQRTQRNLILSLKPAFLKPQIQLQCFNCGATLTGREYICPNCQTQLKPI